MAEFTQRAMVVVRGVSAPHGFNIGMNQGVVAGAGIAAHLHQHVVPRWGGDANFMPVIGHTKVLPELLGETEVAAGRGLGRNRLIRRSARLPSRHAENTGPRSRALIAAIIEGGFGIGWIEWGSSSRARSAWTAVRVLGAVIGLVIIARAIRLRRANPGPAEQSMFAARGYRLVVAAEVIGWSRAASCSFATNRTEYQIGWVAFVVGVHFVAFGKQFAARYYVLGGALIVAAFAGLLVGLAGGGARSRRRSPASPPVCACSSRQRSCCFGQREVPSSA